MNRILRTALIAMFALVLTGGLLVRAAGIDEPWRAAKDALQSSASGFEPFAPRGGQITPEPTPIPTPEPTPLASGASGDDVKAIQKQLTLMGFFTSAQDGVFGPRTEQAVKSYQQYLHELAAPAPTPTPAPISEEAPDATASAAPTATPAPAFEPDGVVSGAMRDSLLKGGFAVYRQDMQRGDSGADVVRLQTRLSGLWYYDSGIDGQYGGGTADAVSYFQKRNDLPQTGLADEQTQRRLFSEEAVKSDRPSTPYKLVVDVSDQCVYAYKWVNGSYSQLSRTMICSTGLKATPTPLGTFKAAGACGRWYYFQKFKCWAQYAYRINGGILFHSVLYSSNDTSTLRQSSVNHLGSRASHGCVRLRVEDAKWIYNNCPAGTTVVVRS